MTTTTEPQFERSEDLNAIAGIRHGFFGRTGPHDLPFDASETLGTPLDMVTANRRLALAAIGARGMSLIGLTQKHTSLVLTIDTPPRPAERPQADGMVTALPDLGLAIITADCAPILFADANSGVIGACHAGWQGAADGIIGNMIEAMTDLGATPETMTIAIGPTISFKNYEVGRDFAERLAKRNPRTEPFLTVPPAKTNLHFDLPGFIVAELQRFGIDRLQRVGTCTYDEPERYFSHRHFTHFSGSKGRQISLIARIKE